MTGKMKAQPSISSRLFLLLFLSGLTALLLGGSALYWEVRELILENLDQALRSDIEIFSGLIHIEEGKIEFEFAEATTGPFSLPRSGHYYQILMDEKVLVASPSLKGKLLYLGPDELVAQNQAARRKTYVTSGPVGEPLRVMTGQIDFPGFPLQVIIGHSLAETYQILHSLRNFLFLFGFIGTWFIAFLGWTISRRSMRPLRDFSTKVDRIGEATLDQRMDVENQYQELSFLACAFNAMLERLQKLLQAREALLSDVSHELKTPVTVIRSHCDIYLQKERPSAEYIEALEVIRTTTDLMGQKIRRLLGFAQTEGELMRGMGFLPLSLEDCLRKARLTVEPLARERQVAITETHSPGLRVNGHAERLIEAFSNLLENAIKYSDRGGTVTISAQGQLDRVIVRIEDNGCGIAPEEIEHIFDRFYRGSSSTSAEGSGLGLVLVKTIIEAHQGSIDVSSRQGSGSCFSIHLPLVR